MTDVSLNQAQQIINSALIEARRLGLQSSTVAVLDRGGHLTALAREDGSSNLRADIAIGKARGALALGQSSRKLSERVAQAPHFFTALAALSAGNVIPVAGGVLIQDSDGSTIGAVGISGDTPDNDEKCAIAALESSEITKQ